LYGQSQSGDGKGLKGVRRKGTTGKGNLRCPILQGGRNLSIKEGIKGDEKVSGSTITKEKGDDLPCGASAVRFFLPKSPQKSFKGGAHQEASLEERKRTSLRVRT